MPGRISDPGSARKNHPGGAKTNARLALQSTNHPQINYQDDGGEAHKPSQLEGKKNVVLIYILKHVQQRPQTQRTGKKYSDVGASTALAILYVSGPRGGEYSR